MAAYPYNGGTCVGSAQYCSGPVTKTPPSSGGGKTGAGGSDGTGPSAGTGTTPAARSGTADQDPGQYLLPVQYRASYVSWLHGWQPAMPDAEAATYALTSIAVFCANYTRTGCGNWAFTDELVRDVHGLDAQTLAGLALGGFGGLGQAYEDGGPDDPGLGALENVTSAEDLDELSCGRQSFTPGTGILLADRKTVPIADLKPGDKVLATSISTGKTQAEPVTAVLVHYDTDLYDLTVTTSHGTEVIHTTSSHLFWDPYLHQWVAANKLLKNERLQTPDGQVAVVVSGSAPADRDGWMWDLTVPGNNDHDFYIDVAGSAVLVHNDSCPNPYGRLGGPAHQAEVDRIANDITDRGLTPQTEYRVETPRG